MLLNVKNRSFLTLQVQLLHWISIMQTFKNVVVHDAIAGLIF